MECQYRNCGVEIKGRTNKKYCSKQCKSNECKYIQRENNKIKEDKLHIVEMLKQISSVDKSTVELFSKIYGR